MSRKLCILTKCLSYLLIIRACLPQLAHAIEPLSYTAVLSSVTELHLNTFLNEEGLGKASDYNIARSDLNGDGVREIILRPSSCQPADVKCTHLILAENKEKILLLSKIPARKLMLSGTFSHGIQDFLAFTNNNNDYEYVRYIWSPSQTTYILDDAR